MRKILFNALIGLLCLEGAAAWGQGNRWAGSAGPGVGRANRGFREPLQRGAAPGVNRVNSAPERENRVAPAPAHPQYLTKAPTKVTSRTPNGRNFDLEEGGFFEPQVVLDPESFSGAVISGMDFSPSGQYLAVAGDVVRIWDIQASPIQLVHTLRGQREFGGVGSCTDVAYSPDGKYLLVSVNGFNASLRVYDTADFTEIKEVYGGHDGHIVQVAFSQDGKYLATAGADNHIHIWNWAQRVKEQSYRLTKPIVHLAFPCPHPNLLALTDDGDLFYWSLETGKMADEGHRKPVYELYANRPPVRAGRAHAHATVISLPSRLSVLGVYDQTKTNQFICSVWGHDANNPLAEHAHQYFVTACAVEPKARIVASADALGQVHLWSIDRGTEIARFKNQVMGVFSVAFDDASRLGFGRTPYKVGSGWNYNHYGALNEVIDLSSWTAPSIDSSRYCHEEWNSGFQVGNGSLHPDKWRKFPYHPLWPLLGVSAPERTIPHRKPAWLFGCRGSRV